MILQEHGSACLDDPLARPVDADSGLSGGVVLHEGTIARALLNKQKE